MKFSPKLLHAIAFMIFIAGMPACKKIHDKIHKDPTATIDACSIQRIITTDEGRTYTFTYNSEGDPVSVINDMVGTGYPNFFFYYDAASRLKEAIALYGNGNYESWHKYGYDGSGKIVKDTQYVFGVYGPEPDPSSVYVIEHTLMYDAANRVIKDEGVYIHPADYEPFTRTYTYNSSGNLTGGAYDARVSLHRTHKIWMFMDRNYSRNNRIPATSYNAYGLPLNFNNATPYNFLGMPINHSNIEYECDASIKY